MKKILMLMMAIAGVLAGLHAQKVEPLKIVTHHADFGVEVKRCVVNGSAMIVDLLLYNNGESDVDMYICPDSPYEREKIRCYDAQGHMYCASARCPGVDKYEYGHQQFKIEKGGSAKLSIRFEGVPESMTTVARMLVPFFCPQWDLTYPKPLTLRNIPCAR